MNWGFEDLIAAVLIGFGVVSSVVLVRRTIRSRRLRVVLIVGVLALATIIWAQLAVGIV